MNKPELSIIFPGIRTDRWDHLYDTILEGTKKTFELIIVGPYPLTEKLEKLPNVRWIEDFGSPTRCQNIAQSHAVGKVVFWISDDSIILKNSIDDNVDLLYSMGDDYKNVVVAKYYEGQNGTHKPLQPDGYFLLNFSNSTSGKFIPNFWWTFNVAFMYKEFLDELGGLDCKFEVCPMAYADIAVRAQLLGSTVIMSKYPLLDCDHMPGTTGDHGPIHYAQTEHDEALYHQIYDKEDWLFEGNRDIKLDNWKDAPSVWKRRFK